jgi:hypothetical protein
MIDNKILDQMSKYPQTYIKEDLTNPDFKELLRLARLGLWAEKHFDLIVTGLRSMQHFNDRLPPSLHEQISGTIKNNPYSEALAALPKVKP